jgi:hypothetical protein
MKKLLFNLFLVFFSYLGLAQSNFVIDNVYFTITGASTVAVFDCSNYAVSVNIPEVVHHNGVDYTVTAIYENAFKNNPSLTYVDIPNTIEFIGSKAFSNCPSLSEVWLPENANISSDVFCQTRLVFDGITYSTCNESLIIGEYEFIDPGFATFHYRGEVYRSFKCCVWICQDDRTGAVSIPSHIFANNNNFAVTSIDEYAFKDCTLLTSITLPNTIDYIETGSFRNCSSLTSFDIPYGVNVIESGTFENCINLTSVSIPNTIIILGEIDETLGVFENCISLTHITIPSSVSVIGKYTFWNCSSLSSITSLREEAVPITYLAFHHGNNHSGPSDNKILNVPFGSDYSSWHTATSWGKTNYMINEGESKTLNTRFVVNDTTGLINEGVLRIAYPGELVNQTQDSLSGFFEIETNILSNNSWSFIAAPLSDYALNVIIPGTRDISISLFDYSSGDWSEDWASVEDTIGGGEGFFAWSFANEPTVFTSYGDGSLDYDFNALPTYSLNNNDVIVSKNLTTNPEGGNWMALANPYTFRIDIEDFLAEQVGVQGGVVYRFNGTNWIPSQSGAIDLTEGFFLNFTNSGSQSAIFKKQYLYSSSAKSEKTNDLITLSMQDGERVIDLHLSHNPKAKNGYDIFDADKMFSPFEISEPYLVTDGINLVKEEVDLLPYYAQMNVRSFQEKEVSFSVSKISDGYSLILIDGDSSFVMNSGEVYTTKIFEGENEDRFQLLLKKVYRLEEMNNHQIVISNNNRLINIESIEEDLFVKVFNLLGEEVFQTSQMNFTLEGVASGVYMVKAFNRKTSQTTKIVIE